MTTNKDAEFILSNYMNKERKDPFRIPGSERLTNLYYRIIGVDLNPDSKKCVLIKLHPSLILKDKELNCSYNKNTAYNKAGIYYKGKDPRKVTKSNSKVFKWIKPEEL